MKEILELAVNLAKLGVFKANLEVGAERFIEMEKDVFDENPDLTVKNLTKYESVIPAFSLKAYGVSITVQCSHLTRE